MRNISNTLNATETFLAENHGKEDEQKFPHQSLGEQS